MAIITSRQFDERRDMAGFPPEVKNLGLSERPAPVIRLFKFSEFRDIVSEVDLFAVLEVDLWLTPITSPCKRLGWHYRKSTPEPVRVPVRSQVLFLLT